MTLLIIEQGAAIQSQGNLIKVLMPESHQFWAQKGKEIGEKALAQAKAQKQGQAHSESPSAQAAPAPAAPEHQSRAAKTAKPQLPPPTVPASDLGDQRRMLRTI